MEAWQLASTLYRQILLLTKLQFVESTVHSPLLSASESQWMHDVRESDSNNECHATEMEESYLGTAEIGD